MGQDEYVNVMQDEYVNVMQERLNWCVETENYEMAAKLRDLIEYETTNDKTIKDKYYMQLAKKYAPDFYEAVKHKYPSIELSFN